MTTDPHSVLAAAFPAVSALFGAHENAAAPTDLIQKWPQRCANTLGPDTWELTPRACTHYVSVRRPDSNRMRQDLMSMACPDDTCGSPVAIASATSRLLSAIDDLLDAQGSSDTTWLSIDHAMTFCDAFVEHYPTMTISTLIGGLDVTSAALHARANHERPEGGDR